MILNGWKEIANHLGRGVRTVQRWESLGLPIRRPRRRDRSAVCAFTNEVDDWLRTAPRSANSDSPQAATDKAGARFSARILVVDDDEPLLVTTAAALIQEGYDVRTARDGFEALTVLRGSVPDLMISDLKMPNMSGFELLSVVRKRFPAMSVIAISGEFAPASPPTVLADRYVQKGTKSISELKQIVRELLSEAPLRSQPARATPAPTWVPRSTTEYVVMTCAECLRPFAVPMADIELDKTATESCPNCGHDFEYLIDSTFAATDVVLPSVLRTTHKRLRASKDALQEAIIAVSKKRNG